MGRAKLNLKPIQDERVRSSTFKKRAASLTKKTEELGILCGVQICVIIAGPPVSRQPQEVVTWPENNPAAIKQLIENYTSQPSSEIHRKRTLTLSDVLDEQKRKAEISLTKMRKGNNELKYPTWDERFNCLPEERLREFGGFLEVKLEGIRAKIKMLKNEKKTKMLLTSENFGVENENINNFGVQYFASGHNELGKRKLIDFLQPQIPPGFKLNDSFAHSNQGHQLDQNSAMMRFRNDNNYTQFNGGASSSNMIYAPPINPRLIYYDPTFIASPSPFCYYAPALQPIGPVLQVQMNSGASSQIHGFQVNEYGQGCDKSKMRD